ncbi:MAG: hypothetical protein ACRDEA_20570 [Microcystaceae cyanobacterium]
MKKVRVFLWRFRALPGKNYQLSRLYDITSNFRALSYKKLKLAIKQQEEISVRYVIGGKVNSTTRLDHASFIQIDCHHRRRWASLRVRQSIHPSIKRSIPLNPSIS